MPQTAVTPETEPLYKVALKMASKAGYAIIREGGEVMGAAVAAVTILGGEHADQG